MEKNKEIIGFLLNTNFIRLFIQNQTLLGDAICIPNNLTLVHYKREKGEGLDDGGEQESLISD